MEELNRINAENKKLTEMLTVLCEHYNALQNQFKELVMTKNNSENIETSKKRKAECEDYTNMIGFNGNAAESSCSDDQESCKKPKVQCIKAKISRVYVPTNPSDNSLVCP